MPGYRAVYVSLKKARRGAGRRHRCADGVGRRSRRSLQLRRSARDPHAESLARGRGAGQGASSCGRRSTDAGLATPNIGTLTDMICCPGLDFCSLANAGSIDVAKLINERFDDYDYLYDLGELDIKMSGCMNACGHHHVGHIGILGVDKGGEEWYQITIGGAAGADASLGQVIGPSVAKTDVRRNDCAAAGRLRRTAAARGALPRYRAPPRRQALQGKSVCRAGCCVTAGSSTMIGCTPTEAAGEFDRAADPHPVANGRASATAGSPAAAVWASCCRRRTRWNSWRPISRGFDLIGAEFSGPSEGRGYYAGSAAAGTIGTSAASCAPPATCTATKCFSWRAAASTASNCRTARSTPLRRHCRPFRAAYQPSNDAGCALKLRRRPWDTPASA